MNRVVYLGYYNIKGEKPIRSTSLAGVNKMDYIIDCLERLNCNLEVLSPSNSIKEVKGYLASELTKNSNGTLIKFLQTYAGKSVFSKILRRFIFTGSLLFELLRLDKRTTVIAYHSLAYSSILKFAKRVAKFRLILEIEEIYSDILVHQGNDKLENKIIDIADAYIVSSNRISRFIKDKTRKIVVSCGNYKVTPRVDITINDSRVHVVYAGTFEAQKGGAVQAIKAAQFLDERFHVHILGFGSFEETERIKKMIVETNLKSKSTITYDGKLTGDRFVHFLQKCQIGLSTQNPEGDYNNSSFPSKILTYLSNGLSVVSVDIPVVRESPVQQLITFYSGVNEEDIAQAINRAMAIDRTEITEVLNHIDNEFIINLKEIL